MTDIMERIKAEEARRAQIKEMLRVAEEREARGQAGIESATPFEGGVLDPRTGTYKNRAALVDNYDSTVGEAMVGGGMQGVSLGWGDEIIGAGDEFRREFARARLEEQKREHPYAFGGSELAGNVVTGLASAPLATGKNLLGTMLRGGIIGGTEGAVYGSGQGEGREDRLSGAMNYGMMGAGLGAAAPAVVAAGGTGLDAILGALGLRNKSRAASALADTVVNSGRSVDDIADDVARAAADGQPEFRLMDAAGQAGQRRASGIVRSGGDASEELAQFLAERQANQGDRVASFVGDAFGVSGTSAKATRTTLDAARRAANNPNYEAARAAAGPVNLNNAIDTIDALMKRDPILGQSALSKSEIGSRLAKIRSRLADGGEQLIDFDSVLNVKEDLGEEIARIKMARGTVPAQLAKVYGALDDALEASSDAYRLANDTARAGRQVVEAVDTGATMARPSQRAIDTTAEFQAMTPEAQAAARSGYGDAFLAKIEANTAPTSNKAKPLTSMKAKAEADVMATDPRLLSDRVARETTMWETQNRALGGSRTADNLQDIADLGPMAEVARIGSDALTSNLAAAGSGVWDMIASRAAKIGGQNESTRKLIAEALMSSDPRAALQDAMRNREVNTTIRRIVEALLRNSSREPTNANIQAVMPR